VNATATWIVPPPNRISARRRLTGPPRQRRRWRVPNTERPSAPPSDVPSDFMKEVTTGLFNTSPMPPGPWPPVGRPPVAWPCGFRAAEGRGAGGGVWSESGLSGSGVNDGHPSDPIADPVGTVGGVGTVGMVTGEAPGAALGASLAVSIS
jgi:hypothetical protein